MEVKKEEGMGINNGDRRLVNTSFNKVFDSFVKAPCVKSLALISPINAATVADVHKLWRETNVHPAGRRRTESSPARNTIIFMLNWQNGIKNYFCWRYWEKRC